VTEHRWIWLPADLIDALKPSDRAWTPLEAVCDLGIDLACGMERSDRYYAGRWGHSRSWVKARRAEAATINRTIDHPQTHEIHSKPLVLDGHPTGQSTGKSTTRKRGKETPPPDTLSAEDHARLVHWIEAHQRPEVRALADELGVLVERCLAWHGGHDTRHVNWLKVVQTWILKEPKTRARPDGGRPRPTRSEGWDQAARKL
jgi:hypothetical protein